MTEFDMEKMMKKYANKRLTRGKAIKMYCKEMCCAGDMKSWRECNAYACPLWKFRLGVEVLGNTGSFKKQRQVRGNITKNEGSQDG